MTYPNFRSMPLLLAVSLALWFLLIGPDAFSAGKHLGHPRPSGYAEANAPGDAEHVEFQPVTKDAGFVFDLVAHFPKEAAPDFQVASVELNGAPQEPFLVRNQGVINAAKRVHDIEDFSVSFYAHWQPGQIYTIKVAGVDAKGQPVAVEQQATAPAERAAVKGLSFAPPSADFPYHNATMTLAKESLSPGTVTLVEVDGQRNRDARFFNVGLQLPEKTSEGAAKEGETYTGAIEGSRDFQITVPVNWTQGSQHTVRVTVKKADESEQIYEQSGTAGGAGGYWNKDWPGFFSMILTESEGAARNDEPIQVAVAPFADDIGDAHKEIRVVTYDPTNPEAGADGYVIVPHQILSVQEWRDEKMLNAEERDKETGELVHRYDATTTVELVFYADVLPYQKKVYQILYGNTKAEAPAVSSSLYVKPGQGLSHTIGNDSYEVFTSLNSGALETVTIKGGAGPVLLEHKLETNGAVHWNPDFYSPPTPWVHVSDWENPELKDVSGPLMYYTRCYAPLPHMTDVTAHVSYSFYGSQPYIVFTTLMESARDTYVSALRNLEIVFNHAVLNEFIWLDAMGKVQSLPIDDKTKLHPVHALDIPPDTRWMALINREKKVGFASVQLEYVNTNRYGDMRSQGQPYIYVQNGPWVYWSRGIVYPFAGNNMTRLMPVRKGSLYYEKNAWLPFRFSEGDNPFSLIEETRTRLKHPLFVYEWMPTNQRAPEKWVMPILTMPFDEGVAGAVSAHKADSKKEN